MLHCTLLVRLAISPSAYISFATPTLTYFSTLNAFRVLFGPIVESSRISFWILYYLTLSSISTITINSGICLLLSNRLFRLWLLPKQCHRVLRSSLSCPSAPAHWASSSDGVTARRLLRGRELGRGFEFLMASWYAFVIKLWAFEVGICDTSACREHSRSQACVRVVIVVNVDWDFFSCSLYSY